MAGLSWGEAVAKALKKRGKTQDWLALRVRVKPPTICRYIAGIRSPRGDVAARVQRVLGVPVSLLGKAAA